MIKGKSKDRAEKWLEDYPDVFADIVNVFLYGREVITPGQLVSAQTETVFKDVLQDGIYEQRRDVCKYVYEKDRCIFIIGIENQTKPDPEMVLRVMNYDAATYAGQRDKAKYSKKNSETIPVMTIVLYFGKEPWNAPCSLHDIQKIPEEAKGICFVQQVKSSRCSKVREKTS